jgi:hypothetical protein
MSYPEFLIDKRVIERNVQKGIVDAKEHAKLLERLPDVQNNAQACQPEMEAAESDDADDDADDEGED